MELERGQVAVVTGGASGIGYAMAEAFAAAGLSVVLADVQRDALDAAVSNLHASHGTPVLGVHTDVSKEADVNALAAVAMERFGAVHVLCNNAGVGGAGDPWSAPTAVWEWVIGVNLWSVVYGVRAFLPHLTASHGHVVNTASIAGLLPVTSAPYDATKHAVVALTENLYNSLAAQGIDVGVSCLCPGFVRTGIADSTRNWPSDLGPLPAVDQARSEATRRIIAEGMPPAQVADLVVEAIRERRFWIFPHPDFVDAAMARFHTIGEGRNPTPPGRLNG